MYKIFETHAHFDDEAFDGDRDELILSMKENGIEKIVNIGASIETSQNTLRLMDKYSFIYGAIGVHPSEVDCLENFEGGERRAIEKLEEMAKSNVKTVAIGEIGLDYHYDNADKVKQKKWFIKQMELARKLSLPIVVHSRDAAEDTVNVMKETDAAALEVWYTAILIRRSLQKYFLIWAFISESEAL